MRPNNALTGNSSKTTRTIGGALADDNMEVIDFGVPVLSIHTPYSVSSKVDVYHLYRAMHAFFQSP